MIFSTLAFAAALCQIGSELNWQKIKTPCTIHGDSASGNKKVFSLDCGRPAAGQIEYAEGAGEASILDPISREKIANCSADRAALNKLIAAYQELAAEPRCRLEKDAGQLIFFNGKAQSRCSFRMNRSAYAEFVKATGKKPFYQCENDYFILTAEHSDSDIYARKNGRWSLECSGHMHVVTGEAASKPAQDPASYYQPDEPTFIP